MFVHKLSLYTNNHFHFLQPHSATIWSSLKLSQMSLYAILMSQIDSTCKTNIWGSISLFFIPLSLNITNILTHSDFRKTCISKTAGHGAKFGSQGVSIQCTQGTFDTWVLKVIRCICSFRNTCISKTAGRRAKWSETWASGVSIHCTQGTFDT